MPPVKPIQDQGFGLALECLALEPAAMEPEPEAASPMSSEDEFRSRKDQRRMSATYHAGAFTDW